MRISISGACSSGKTTAINKIKSICNDKGIPIEIASEFIRENKDIVSIDEIRKDSNRYFKLQHDVIMTRIKMETTAPRKGIFLTDRNLIDTLYYYQNYVTDKNIVNCNGYTYHTLLDYLLNYIKTDTNLDLIILMKPLKGVGLDDPMREKNLINSQNSEWEIIRALNYGFYNGRVPILEVDALTWDIEKAIDWLKNDRP